jgi:hypothetical protein
MDMGGNQQGDIMERLQIIMLSMQELLEKYPKLINDATRPPVIMPTPEMSKDQRAFAWLQFYHDAANTAHETLQMIHGYLTKVWRSGITTGEMSEQMGSAMIDLCIASREIRSLANQLDDITFSHADRLIEKYREFGV